MSIEGTTKLVPPRYDATDVGIKILKAKLRRHMEDYLRFIRRFGLIFDNAEEIARLKRECDTPTGCNVFIRGLLDGGLAAKEYIFGKDDWADFLQFEPTCDLLGIDYHSLRKRFKRIKTKEEAAKILSRFHRMYAVSEKYNGKQNILD